MEGIKSMSPLLAREWQRILPGRGGGAYRLSVLLPMLSGAGKEDIVFTTKTFAENLGRGDLLQAGRQLAHGVGVVGPSLATAIPGAIAGGATGAAVGGPVGAAVGAVAGALPSSLMSSVHHTEREVVQRQGYREVDEQGKMYAGARRRRLPSRCSVLPRWAAPRHPPSGRRHSG